MTLSALQRRARKPVVFLVSLVPAALLLADFLRDRLGPNPIEELTHRTGFWGLTFITITLAITPLRRLTNWNGAITFRRLLGLFGFFYITLHFLVYLVLDQFFAWSYIVEDIAERPYITVGFSAWLMLIALAATSTAGMIRRLGKRWRRLHALVYVIALAGVVHFMWLVKADRKRPLIFAYILLALLGSRLVRWRPTRKGRRRIVPPGKRPAATAREEAVPS